MLQKIKIQSMQNMNKITMPFAIPGLYKDGVFEPRFTVPKISQPRKVMLIFLEETKDNDGDILTPASPPVKDAKTVTTAFRKTGKYTERFMKGLEKGLRRSSYFT